MSFHTGDRVVKQNPSVLITGGARRLGLALARESVSLGFDVVVHHRSDRRPVEQWLRQEPALASRVRIVTHDLREPCAELIDRVLDMSPRLTGLVNNASVFGKGNLSDAGHFRDSLRVNALAPLELSLRFLQKVKKGWIVNVTDARLERVNLSYQNYRLSKILLNEITRQLAVLCAPRVRVNAIAPDLVLRSPDMTATEFARLRRLVPLGSTIRVTDVLRAFEYLVTSASVTGQILYVDGGSHLG
jgi:pteridine reductase